MKELRQKVDGRTKDGYCCVQVSEERREFRGGSVIGGSAGRGNERGKDERVSDGGRICETLFLSELDEELHPFDNAHGLAESIWILLR